ncbi:MAG: hypothetical protein JWR72_3923 [Flavisolibacter sp.]|jgi:hypothetical protein|nr:hypothetical protein [Flavisolibacter sp.]
MSTAEIKMEVMEFLVKADDEIAGELVEFTRKLAFANYTVSKEDVAKYEKRLSDFETSGEKGLSKEESLALLKAQLK